MGMREVKDDERVDGRPWRPLRGQWVRSSNYSTPTDTGLLVGRVKTAVAWSSMRNRTFPQILSDITESCTSTLEH